MAAPATPASFPLDEHTRGQSRGKVVRHSVCDIAEVLLGGARVLEDGGVFQAAEYHLADSDPVVINSHPCSMPYLPTDSMVVIDSANPDLGHHTDAMDRHEARRLLEWPTWRGVKRVSFDGLDLTSVSIAPQPGFDRCSFVGTDFRMATLDRASFKMCDFTGANFRGASLRGAWFGGCNLCDVDLRDADLTGAHLNYVNTGTDTTGRTNASGARLSGATLHDIQIDRVIGWPEQVI